MKEIKIQIPDGKTAEWINGVLTLVDEAPKDITERIKTLDDARKELDRRAEAGDEDAATLLSDYESNVNNIQLKETLAYMKLCIIAAALNEGWKPTFEAGEFRYHPYFTLYTQDEIDGKTAEWKEEHSLVLWGGNADNGAHCGLAYAASDGAFSGSAAHFGARLAVRSEELAVYFAKQFIDIWAEYVLSR